MLIHRCRLSGTAIAAATCGYDLGFGDRGLGLEGRGLGLGTGGLVNISAYEPLSHKTRRGYKVSRRQHARGAARRRRTCISTGDGGTPI